MWHHGIPMVSHPSDPSMWSLKLRRVIVGLGVKRKARSQMRKTEQVLLSWAVFRDMKANTWDHVAYTLYGRVRNEIKFFWLQVQSYFNWHYSLSESSFLQNEKWSGWMLRMGKKEHDRGQVSVKASWTVGSGEWMDTGTRGHRVKPSQLPWPAVQVSRSPLCSFGEELMSHI